MHWLTGKALFLIWAFGYLAMIWPYVLWLRRTERPVYMLEFACVVAASIFIAGWFAAMCFFITTLGAPVFAFVGVCGTCGLALHNLGRHAAFTTTAISDLVMVLLLVTATTIWYIAHIPDTAADVALAIAALSIGGYYTQNYVTTIRTRLNLAQSLAEETQAQKMRSLGQLTAGIAHDFNNKLTVIQGNLELHEEISDPYEKRRALHAARLSSLKAADLVTQLLAFSRKSPIAPKSLMTTDVYKYLDVLGGRIVPANVTLDVLPVVPDLCVKADETLLHAALTNIIVNACDAMVPNGGRITIKTGVCVHRNLSGGTQALVKIAITDTGPGVPEDVLPRLIEPFYTSKGVGEGSGLGLSMVSGFAEQSGGKLEIENAPDRGLCVTLYLPECDQEERP